MDGDGGEILAEDRFAKLVTLHKLNGLPAQLVGCVAKASDTGKEIDEPHQ